ncbi:hypothetical protein E2C01_033248 [Portunus trituberculatus]|uniref:Uncharacterized protein n=1 Tax=Portunus trituberculatus TaxID=210409 RepID=A0A5B7F3P2_PORTR|nr:hypothetical protein [Portunus trituberculatus]
MRDGGSRAGSRTPLGNWQPRHSSRSYTLFTPGTLWAAPTGHTRGRREVSSPVTHYYGAVSWRGEAGEADEAEMTWGEARRLMLRGGEEAEREAGGREGGTVAGFIAGSRGSGSSLAVEMEGHVYGYLLRVLRESGRSMVVCGGVAV